MENTLEEIPILSEFENRLKNISDNAFSHGAKSLTTDERKNLATDKKVQNKFKAACHNGYGIAQKLLIEDTVFYQKHYTAEQENLRVFKKAKNLSAYNNTQLLIQEITHRLNCLAHIADGIAWSIIGGHLHIARRLYLGVKTKSFLEKSNLDHAVRVVDSINSNPANFALIADLTSFVQIADLLVKLKKGFGLMELKEGLVNHEIKNFLYAEDPKNDQDFLENLTPKKIKQAERMVRQIERVHRAVTVINKDEGIDPRLQVPIKIYTPTIFSEKYSEIFRSMEKEMNKTGYSVESIEECLIFNFLKDEYREIGSRAIIESLKERTENYIVLDWLSILNAVSEPLFAKPLSPDFITQMMAGKIHVWVGVDGDQLLAIFNSAGFKSSWMTVKETNRLKQKQNGLVRINGKGIWLEYGDEKSGLNGGIMSKILYDNHKPSNVAQILYSVSISKEAN